MKHFEAKMKHFEAKMNHFEANMKHFEAKMKHFEGPGIQTGSGGISGVLDPKYTY